MIAMSQSPEFPELTPEQEDRVEAETKKLGNRVLALARLGLSQPPEASDGQKAHAARVDQRSADHAYYRDEFGQGVGLAAITDQARRIQQEQANQQPTLDDDMFDKK